MTVTHTNYPQGLFARIRTGMDQLGVNEPTQEIKSDSFDLNWFSGRSQLTADQLAYFDKLSSQAFIDLQNGDKDSEVIEFVLNCSLHPDEKVHGPALKLLASKEWSPEERAGLASDLLLDTSRSVQLFRDRLGMDGSKLDKAKLRDRITELLKDSNFKQSLQSTLKDERHGITRLLAQLDPGLEATAFQKLVLEKIRQQLDSLPAEPVQKPKDHGSGQPVQNNSPKPSPYLLATKQLKIVSSSHSPSLSHSSITPIPESPSPNITQPKHLNQPVFEPYPIHELPVIKERIEPSDSPSPQTTTEPSQPNIEPDMELSPQPPLPFNSEPNEHDKDVSEAPKMLIPQHAPVEINQKVFSEDEIRSGIANLTLKPDDFTKLTRNELLLVSELSSSKYFSSKLFKPEVKRHVLTTLIYPLSDFPENAYDFFLTHMRLHDEKQDDKKKSDSVEDGLKSNSKNKSTNNTIPLKDKKDEKKVDPIDVNPIADILSKELFTEDQLTFFKDTPSKIFSHKIILSDVQRKKLEESFSKSIGIKNIFFAHLKKHAPTLHDNLLEQMNSERPDSDLIGVSGKKTLMQFRLPDLIRLMKLDKQGHSIKKIDKLSHEEFMILVNCCISDNAKRQNTLTLQKFNRLNGDLDIIFQLDPNECHREVLIYLCNNVKRHYNISTLHDKMDSIFLRMKSNDPTPGIRSRPRHVSTVQPKTLGSLIHGGTIVLNGKNTSPKHLAKHIGPRILECCKGPTISTLEIFNREENKFYTVLIAKQDQGKGKFRYTARIIEPNDKPSYKPSGFAWNLHTCLTSLVSHGSKKSEEKLFESKDVQLAEVQIEQSGSMTGHNKQATLAIFNKLNELNLDGLLDGSDGDDDEAQEVRSGFLGAVILQWRNDSIETDLEGLDAQQLYDKFAVMIEQGGKKNLQKIFESAALNFGQSYSTVEDEEQNTTEMVTPKSKHDEVEPIKKPKKFDFFGLFKKK